MEKLKVMIVDDHRVLAESLSALLGAEPGIRICGTAGNLAEAESVFARTKPDVILLDLNLGENESGFSLLEKVKAANPGVRVIIVSTYDGETFRSHASQLGADDYVAKGAAASEIIAAIRHAASSDSARPGAYAPAGASDARRRALYEGLSPSERKTLLLLTEGYSQKEIAHQMGVSASTVATYVQRSREKFGARSLVHLISIAETVVPAKEGK